MKLTILIIVTIFMTGCATKTVVVCDRFPTPKKSVLLKVKDLKDKEVDKWIKDLLILKSKLKLNCKGDKSNGR